MSTKGLMADKRVELVTLNDAGKAATLTLKAPWTFEGSAGPFALTNVEHGHKIVKGATGGVITRSPRGAPPPRSAPLSPTGEPTGAMLRDPGSETPSLASPAPSPREAHKSFVYRMVRTSDLNNHEIVGWLKATRKWTPKMLADHTAELFKSHERDNMTDYEDRSYLWTPKHEKEARAANDLGCPWPSEIAS